jgi:hypothetical protein
MRTAVFDAGGLIDRRSGFTEIELFEKAGVY